MLNHLTRIINSALSAADPYEAVKKVMRLKGDILYVNNSGYNLSRINNIFVVGGGKASAKMALAVEDLLGSRIRRGLICVKTGYTVERSMLEIREASHPLPCGSGMNAANEINTILQSADENDLIISLISGGASALLPLPVRGITLEDKIAATQLLLNSGAAIHEINCVRKKLSTSKGGGFAASARPARVINLLISDVVGDDPAAIGSGPFIYDNTGYKDALQIIEKYGLSEKIPSAVYGLIKGNAAASDSKTHSSDDEALKRIETVICCSNITALEAAGKTASALGYSSLILSSMIEGENRATARFHRDILFEAVKSGNPVPPPACVISGGETTVKVTGSGLGGRNMDFVMNCIKDMHNTHGVILGRVGTDGTDGPTDAAGAWCDGSTFTKCVEAGIDIDAMIADNDSYRLFEKIDQLIITGPTNTNVMDITIMLIT